MMGRRIEIGKKYGKLTVEGVVEIKGYISADDMVMKCRCDCGGYKTVPIQRLEDGLVHTCGCAWKPKGKKK